MFEEVDELESQLRRELYDFIKKKYMEKGRPGKIFNYVFPLQEEHKEFFNIETIKVKDLLSLLGEKTDDKSILEAIGNPISGSEITLKKTEVYLDILKQLPSGLQAYLKYNYPTSKSFYKALEEGRVNAAVNLWTPANNKMLISEFAYRRIKDSHALDKGRYAYNILCSILLFRYGDLDFNRHNIEFDDLSAIVKTGNIVNNSNNIYDIISEADLSRLEYIKDSKILIVENAGVASSLIRQGAKVVCSDGNPNHQVHRLISILKNNGNKLFYSGDLDMTGVSIASRIKTRHPYIELFGMNLETFRKHEREAVTSPKQQRLDRNIHKELLELAQEIEKGKVIYQEIIDFNYFLEKGQ